MYNLMESENLLKLTEYILSDLLEGQIALKFLNSLKYKIQLANFKSYIRT